LSGHGFGPSVDDTALLMANASLATLHHAPAVKYANYFREAPIFSEIVLLMDCCRDHHARPPLVDLGLPVLDPRASEARFFFGFATRWTLRARESADPDGQVRGHFTRAIIEAFDEPGASSETVPAFVEVRLPELARRRGYYPPEFRTGGKTPISFNSRAGRRTEPPCTVNVTFAPAPRVLLRVIDSNEAIVAETLMKDSPWGVELSRGLYELVRSDRPRQAERIRVPAAGSLDVRV
jgi:hypothetical protein